MPFVCVFTSPTVTRCRSRLAAWAKHKFDGAAVTQFFPPSVRGLLILAQGHESHSIGHLVNFLVEDPLGLGVVWVVEECHVDRGRAEYGLRMTIVEAARIQRNEGEDQGEKGCKRTS